MSAVLTAIDMKAIAQVATSPTPSRAGRSPRPAGQTAIASARGVLSRQLGDRAAEFDLEWIPLEDGHEVYEMEVTDGKIKVSGSSGVAICRGVYSYLRESCNAMSTWSGHHLDLPSQIGRAHV